jgi:DNA topoisomerase-1
VQNNIHNTQEKNFLPEEKKTSGGDVVIVESPAKARTIKRFLGGGFSVCASLGHIRDLPQKKLGVEVENDFQPTYVVIPRRRKTVSMLKKAAQKADNVYLATDLDREGEAIAWHLKEVLGLGDDKTWRVIFNEITPNSIKAAFARPGKIDMNKVSAQAARRILDRLVGYMLSPLLWKKVARGLSAGRVQSVAVRMVVEREKEIEDFVPQEFWKITATLAPKKGDGDAGKEFLAELVKKEGNEYKPKNEVEAKSCIEELEKEDFRVASFEEKEALRYAPPPFTTSRLQQVASRVLRFSPSKTMRIAQQLYEGLSLGKKGRIGIITYMRTDAVRVSRGALNQVRSLIKDKFGEEFLPEKPHFFKARGRIQAAHEAIRPTSVARQPEEIKSHLTPDQFKLYNLIWKCFVASQMKPVKLLEQTSQIEAGKYTFLAKGRKILFPGHSLVSSWGLKKEEQNLPRLRPDQILDLLGLEPTQHFTKPPPRYSPASLIRALEEKGIGRPSTYAPIISTIQQRGYVRLQRRVFYATEVGTVVTEKLIRHFPQIMDVNFTSQMEEGLDDVEEAKTDWLEILREFYEPFKQALKAAEEQMVSVSDETAEVEKVCPKCGSPLVSRMSRYGRFLACSAFPKCKYKETLTEKKELAGKKCPKCGASLVVRSGPYGKFLGCSAYPQCDYKESLKAKGRKSPTRQSRYDDGAKKPSGAPQKRRRLKRKKTPEATDVDCPEDCGGKLVRRRGPRGYFYGCSNFPHCKYTSKSLPTSGQSKSGS